MPDRVPSPTEPTRLRRRALVLADASEPGRLSATDAPTPLTVDEAADLLRTSRRAVYAMVDRRQVEGVVRLSRRVLFHRATLLDWLDQKRAPSRKE